MAGLNDAIESSGIIGLVSKIAPVLGSVLGSPLAGVGVSLISQALGLASPSVNGIVDALTRDPEAVAKLKELEFNHAETLEKIAQQFYATEVDDRKDARQYGVQYKDFMRHMAYLVTFGFLGTLILLFLPFPLDANEHDLILVLVGMLASKWQTIIDFFYGSSSQHKNSFVSFKKDAP